MRTSSSLTLNIPSPLESFTFSEFDTKAPHIDIKRDDLIHGTLSGNKLRKLAGHLSNLQSEQMCGLLTMGGPWSNHLHACGWLCYQLDIPMVALVRGEQPDTLSNMLSDLRNWGIELRFISRGEYRHLRRYYESSSVDMPEIFAEFSDYYFIPEGGRGPLAIDGLSELAAEVNHDYDAVYVGVGTATTLAGLVAHWSNPETHFYGVLAVDAMQSQMQTIEQLAGEFRNRVTLLSEFTFGGFAKITPDLAQFMADIYQHTGLPLEPVYTAKALYAMRSHINEGRYDEQAKILFIHTGGLQGLRGYDNRQLEPLFQAIASG